MISIEQEYSDLIQADLDGELPDVDRARLSRYLLAHPEARDYARDMRLLCERLDGMTSVAPPAGLGQAVDAAVASRSGRRQGGMAAGHPPRVPQMFRYAAVFAGGAMLSAIGLLASPEDPAGVTQLVGTMAAHDDSQHPVASADELHVTASDVRGTVSLFAAGSTLVVKFDLEARRSLEVVAACAGREIRLNGTDATGGVGLIREAVAFEGGGDQESRVSVRILDGTTVLFEGVLDPSSDG
jgi:anti-sigma factor RsiW